MKRQAKLHDERRTELLDIARDYFYQKGYEATSIADIIRTASIAKGTFYHYFVSKEDLLDQLVTRMIVQALKIADSIVTDTSLNALQKLNRYFTEMGHFKATEKEMTMVLIRALYADDNIILRHKMLKRTHQTIIPELAKIIRQGVDEELFDTPYPETIGDLLIGLMADIAEDVATTLLQEESGNNLYKSLDDKYSMLENAFERILGAPRGSVRFVNRDDLKNFIQDSREG